MDSQRLFKMNDKLNKTFITLQEFGQNLTDEEIISLLNEDGSWKSDISSSINLISIRTGFNLLLVSDLLTAYISVNNLMRRLNPKPLLTLLQN